MTNPFSFQQYGRFFRIRLRVLLLLVTLPMLFLPFSRAVMAQRPALTTSKVTGAPTTPLPYRTERVFGDFQFRRPVELTTAPGTDSMFLLTQDGLIYELESETQQAEPRLVASLKNLVPEFHFSYGLEFHPDFVKNRELFICYIRPGNKPDGTSVSRFFATDGDEWTIKEGSEEELYRWKAGGHNGGSVKFGPDGYLYVSAGDAESPFPPDPDRVGQDLSTIRATITRIDVNRKDEGLTYGVPTDNPFVNLEGARPEVFAYGFRNPWRMAFDRKTGDLWAGDVGWELWEMIYLVQSGGNYGWSIVEGPKPTNRDAKRGPTPIIKPAAAHQHTEARSITGGQVYYGSRLPELRGEYIYGDHVTGRIWKLKRDGDKFIGPTQIARAPLQIICFGLHNNGELYVVDYQGAIHRLVRDDREENQEFPRSLSASGLFSDISKLELAPGVLPYEIIAETWMDGGTAERFVAIPDEQQIGVYTVGSGHANWDGKHRGSWKFPKDSVLGKTISLNGHRVETQLMHYDGQAWQGYSYLWNDKQTDAELAEDKTQIVEVNAGGTKQQWLLSNRSECMVCHSNANDMLLGFKPNQLRRPTETHADQLSHMFAVGLFEKKPPEHEPVVSPNEKFSEIGQRARAYLHANCAHCHRPNGGGSVAMNVLFDAGREETRMMDELPLQGSFGIENSRVVASGDPGRSILLYRFCKTGPGHMPKLGGLEVDHAGASLLYEWIASLGAVDDLPSMEQRVSSLKHLASDSSKMIEYLSSVPNSLFAAHAIRNKKLNSSTHGKIMSVSASMQPEIRDIFEALLPASQRTQRLTVVDPATLLAEQGDADLGQALFKSDALACKNCHSVDGRTQSVGPNLASLRADRYAPAALLESLTHPSKRIDEQYQTYTVQTVDGEVLTGVMTNDGDDVVLRDVQAKEHRIAADDIELQKKSDVSLMPEKLLESLTLEQARNLLAYLSALNGS